MPLNRITLKSTSRMSLNDRFTSLREISDTTDGVDQRRQIVQASRKNMRLAQQMEHRPAVIAALGSTQRGRGRGRGRGGRGRGLLQGAQGAVNTVPMMQAVTNRNTFTTRGTGRILRGGSIRGSVRGINFRTGAPLTSRIGATGARNDAASPATSLPIKKRLAVQGRLSQPAFTRRGTAAYTRGSFRPVQTSFVRGASTRGGVRGRGGFRGRGATRPSAGPYQNRTFRGRGRGGRGGYSQQWGDGN
ncbi:chromatin target of PRMT1 protein isoform X2 [Hyalella azteca]|nr:chromatin target of PRMT1 protein isoform X2 [Hyalella azteca]